MTTGSADFPLLRRLPSPDTPADDLLLAFLDYAAERGLTLYPAQEEAILELFSGKHVILSTPTGSGKSLVATALHFRSLALGEKSVYTCPIKALVNEKFLALCRDFGPENVGLMTGDATVNRDAPILCCTAEILANFALTQGSATAYRQVVMDEFHYYSDAQRGWAWQVPLLTLSKAQFLLMSATLGETSFFEKELQRLTGIETAPITGTVRPVPLEFTYTETSLDETVRALVDENKAPVYIVHFTQNDAAQSAQDLLCQNYCTTAEKAAIAEALEGVKFVSPYGKEVKKLLRHGIGIHHAGLLPKYRVLVEQLAQKGLLKLICGTDTLGVGVNVPIRTVLLTKLSKYSGSKTAVLSARDFHQIVGRAGRKGFDDIGYVVCQAPEHIIENTKMERRAAGDPKKLKKMVKKQPPPGFVGWNADTFAKLQAAPPEPLTSRFQVTHGMVLDVLSRPPALGDGCRALQGLIRESHETTKNKKAHRKRAWQLFRSLVARKIVQIIPPAERTIQTGKLRLDTSLQKDFSLLHTLSLWLIDTLALIDPESPNYSADVITLAESILENPDLILRRQLDKLKTDRLNELKAQGVPFEERMAQLEELEHPKPIRDFIYSTFNEFAAAHPWVGQDNIRPKSIVREMYENFRTFSDYIKDYELHRTEGLLLRHLSSVYKVLDQTVPTKFKTQSLDEMIEWLGAIVRGIDSSLLDEWERLRDPNWRPTEKEEAPALPSDITRDKRQFTALIRTEIFRFLKALAQDDFTAAAEVLRMPDASPHAPLPWSADALADAIDPYYDEHERFRLDPEARNLRHTHVKTDSESNAWIVEQILIDPAELNDWSATFKIDLTRSKDEGAPIYELTSLGAVGR